MSDNVGSCAYRSCTNAGTQTVEQFLGRHVHPYISGDGVLYFCETHILEMACRYVKYKEIHTDEIAPYVRHAGACWLAEEDSRGRPRWKWSRNADVEWPSLAMLLRWFHALTREIHFRVQFQVRLKPAVRSEKHEFDLDR